MTRLPAQRDAADNHVLRVPAIGPETAFPTTPPTRRPPKQPCLAAGLAALTLLGLLAAPPSALAQPADLDPGELQAIRERLTESEERREALAEQRREIEAQTAALRNEMIEAAAAVQQREADLTGIEERLEALGAAEAVALAQLNRDRATLVEILAALQRLDHKPPPALTVEPENALDAIRSAILMGAVVPELQEEAEQLRDQLTELATLRRDLDRERAEAIAARESLEAERKRLAGLLDQKLEAEAGLAEALDAERARADRLARQANDLQSLIAELERAAPRVAPRPKPERPEPSSRLAALPPERPAPPAGDSRPSAGQRLAALPPLSGAAATNFAAAKGRLPMPAQGRLVRHFDESDDAGGKTRGITVETRPQAQVIAPYDGKIVFAGPFRNYGQVLIINTGGGYHLVLAGMARITGGVGQRLLAGEPVGTMGSGGDEPGENGSTRANPLLYIEFRKDGEPIDPAPWLVADNRRVSG